MTEQSFFWPTTGTGDGTAGGVSTAQMTLWLRSIFRPVSGGNEGGVNPNYLNGLAVSGSASPVTIATGAAHVYGFPYVSDGAVNVAVPTPSSATRVDRIVLRVNWAAQTVRVTRIGGAEGGGAPNLVQTPGTTYDIPLAQVSITTGGVVSVTDQRVFLKVGA